MATKDRPKGFPVPAPTPVGPAADDAPDDAAGDAPAHAPHLDVPRLQALRAELARLRRQADSVEAQRRALTDKARAVEVRAHQIRELITGMVLGDPGRGS